MSGSLNVDRSVKRKIGLMVLKQAVNSRVSNAYGMTRCYLWRLRLNKDPFCLRKRSTRSVKRHHWVQEFMMSPENSTLLSEKKKVAKGKPRYVLKDTLRNLYAKYRESTDDPVSQSLFQKLRPRNVKLSSAEKLNQCLCDICENVTLKLQAINKCLPSTQRIKSNYHLLDLQACPRDSKSFHKLDCILRKCDQCGTERLNNHFIEVDQSANVVWSKWETKDGRKVLIQKQDTICCLLSELRAEMDSYPLHVFRALWQSKEFSTVKACPPKDSCVSVMDFAENYRCILQDEAQSAHWSYAQATIHPVVNYYACNDCNGLITDVVAFISPDLKHDTHAVLEFSRQYVQVLQSKGYVFDRVLQWTDGCAAQYKNKDAFRDMGVVGCHKIERHFFGSQNACDGESAVIKSAATRAVKARKTITIIQSAKDLYSFCKTFLRKPDYAADGTCNHYRRDFVLVGEIERCNQIELYPVKGTRSLHSIRVAGDNELLTRSLSCFCFGCETGEDCHNSTYAKSWDRVKLRKKHKTSSDHEQLITDQDESSNVQTIDANLTLPCLSQAQDSSDHEQLITDQDESSNVQAIDANLTSHCLSQAQSQTGHEQQDPDTSITGLDISLSQDEMEVVNSLLTFSRAQQPQGNIADGEVNSTELSSRNLFADLIL